MINRIVIFIVRVWIEFNEKIFFSNTLLRFYKKEFKKHNASFILDIGVNVGQSIDMFRKLNKNIKIIAFEPNKTLFNGVLKKKYSKHNTITIHNCGISNRIGQLVFYENVLHSTSSFEKLNYDSKYLDMKAKILGVSKKNIIKKSYEVNVITLSDFIISKHLTQDVDILKIDTEGHEYSCLEGLFDQLIPINIKYIQIEEHTDDMYVNRIPFQKIQNLLTTNGYTLAKKIKHGFGSFYDLIFKKTLSQ